MKFYKYYIALIIFTGLLQGCNKTSWFENYKEKSKSPFGTYIIFNEAEELLDNYKVHSLDENIYDYLNNTYFEEDYTFNYICIKNRASKINQSVIKELLLYVEDGSTAFFSLNDFSSSIKTALNIETENLDEYIYTSSELKWLKGDLSFENKDLTGKKFNYDRNLRRHYFSSYDENSTIVLGTQNIAGTEQPIFLKIYYGKGVIYVHTQPIAFTNYNMLKDNHEYAENVLSYLPNKETLWDPQIRSSKLTNNNSGSDSDSGNGDSEKSVLGFFMENPSLKWFLYLSFFGLITFMIFNARRKQRAIPIMDPPKNSTVEFTHTISNLYLVNEDHKNLVDKKIQFFLEKVRSRYYIDTNNLNKEFIEKLALKSGNDFQKTKYLINTILALHKKEQCSAEELMSLNTMIDNFLKRK